MIKKQITLYIYDDRHQQDGPTDHKYLRTASGNRRGFPPDEGFLLEDFKSTKYNDITYHIIMTLVGYVYFQIYKNLDEGKRYSGRSLPVVVKNYKETRSKAVILYAGQYFGIFSFLELLQIYAECTLEVRRLLDPILAKV